MQNNEVINFQTYHAEDLPETDEPVSQHLPAGTTLLLGQYTIKGYLNCGGFGVTYRARDSLNRDVVIKECFPSEMAYRSGKLMGARTPKFKVELDAIVQHFVKEAHRLAQARHDNIVHVHQIFEENDTAYMAMDFVEGRDLMDIIEAEPDRFTPREVMQIVHKMLHAIKYVHGLGMLHRDISPDNILIDEYGDPVLIDFGAAREYASQSSYRAFSKLKFVKDGYSPQEFYIAGSEQGAWSDLYSFAASMYYVMTGEAPVDGQKRLAALAAKTPDPYKPLAGNVSGYPQRFLKTFDKALRVLPEQRIQSAEQWLALLTPKKRKAPEAAAKPVARLRKQVPGDAQLPAGTLVANIFYDHMRPIAASIGGLALLGGLGFFGVQLLRPTDVQQTVFMTTPPVIAADPQLALVDPAIGGMPEQDVLSVSLDNVTTGLVAGRAPTPPANVSAPISQARPEIGDVAVLAAPDVAIGSPAAPESLGPATRVAGIGEMTVLEVASAPFAPVPEIAHKSELVIPDAQLATFAVPSNVVPLPKSARVASLGVPSFEAAPVADLVPPTVVLPAITDVQRVDAFHPVRTDQIYLRIANVTEVERPELLSKLPAAASDNVFVGDVTPPPLPQRLGPLAAAQVAYASWFAQMPFEADLVQVRNANAAVITTIAEDADLSISGDWIEEGVIIYSFNGERLLADTPLTVHVLQTMKIDPDGYARATVRYRNAEKDIIDRGLLAVPVVRGIGLADGSVIQARMIDGLWALEVKEVGDTTNGLKLGDILLGEAETGTQFKSPNEFTQTLDQLVKDQIDTAVLSIVRDGEVVATEWHLAREIPVAKK